MSKLTVRTCKGEIEVILKLQHMRPGVVLTIEESRALRGELEKAEEEAGRKSAYMTWIEQRKGQSLPQAWNAAIDAVLVALFGTLLPGQEERLRALKEPVE